MHRTAILTARHSSLQSALSIKHADPLTRALAHMHVHGARLGTTRSSRALPMAHHPLPRASSTCPRVCLAQSTPTQTTLQCCHTLRSRWKSKWPLDLFCKRVNNHDDVCAPACSPPHHCCTTPPLLRFHEISHCCTRNSSRLTIFKHFFAPNLLRHTDQFRYKCFNQAHVLRAVVDKCLLLLSTDT